MTAAGGLALIIIGAILKWAVTWRSAWISLDALGTILMVGGAAGLLIGLLMSYTRRRALERRQSAEQVYEQRYYQDPPAP